MVKWKSIRSKHLLETKGTKCTYSKVFEDQSDTYHDTWTHYLMEQEPSLIQDQAGGDGCVEREKRWALQGHAQVDLALDTPCLGPLPIIPVH
jgi:hypothetical protein